MWSELVQNKWNPLHYAAWHGHSESVRLLLAAKGNANAETQVNESLLQMCWNRVVLSCVLWIGAVQVHPATGGSTQRALRLHQAVETSLWLRNSITSPLQRALDEFRSVNRRLLDTCTETVRYQIATHRRWILEEESFPSTLQLVLVVGYETLLVFAPS